MFRFIHRPALLLAAVAFAACGESPSPADVRIDVDPQFAVTSSQAEWELIDLGTLGGAYSGRSYASDINDAGQIVGYSQSPYVSSSHAFLWEDGVMTDLGTLPGLYDSYATGINDAGQVVGYSQDGTRNAQAFLWEDGVMTNLGTLGGEDSRPRGINDAGQVVGYSEIASGQKHAFLWEDGVMTDLGPLGGERQATAINDAGQIVGTSYISGRDHAFLWEDGVMTDLGSLGVYSRTYGHSQPTGLNNAGQMVGFSRLSGQNQAFLWEDGVLTDLATVLSGARDVNDAGQVVGQTGRGGRAAVIWEDGVMTELPVLRSGRQSASAINNAGQVVGNSMDLSGDTHATLWLPAGPQTKDDCKNGGWERYGFKNQGQCVRFVETAKDGR